MAYIFFPPEGFDEEEMNDYLLSLQLRFNQHDYEHGVELDEMSSETTPPINYSDSDEVRELALKLKEEAMLPPIDRSQSTIYIWST